MFFVALHLLLTRQALRLATRLSFNLCSSLQNVSKLCVIYENIDFVSYIGSSGGGFIGGALVDRLMQSIRFRLQISFDRYCFQKLCITTSLETLTNFRV